MAYWNVTFNPQLERLDTEAEILIAQIETSCDILKMLPVGHGMRQKFMQTNRRPHELIQGTFKDDLIIQDIQGTASIEGNMLNKTEIEEAISKQTPQNTQEQEVINLNQVRRHLENVADTNFDGNITEELIRDTNRKIMNNIIDDGDICNGAYRKHGVLVGKNHKPTNFEEIPSKMKEFIEFINSENVKKMNPLIRAMMAHFYIVSIHPFPNGNGRTSRAIESFLFYYEGFSLHGFHSLNNFYYKNYKEYFNILDQSRFKYNGCLLEFIKFGLRGFLSEIQEIKKHVTSFTIKKAYLNYIQELFEFNILTSRQLALLTYFNKFGVDITEAMFLSKDDPILKEFYQNVKSKKTIQRDLDTLKKEMLIEIDENKMIKNNYNVMIEKFT